MLVLYVFRPNGVVEFKLVPWSCFRLINFKWLTLKELGGCFYTLFIWMLKQKQSSKRILFGFTINVLCLIGIVFKTAVEFEYIVCYKMILGQHQLK